MPFLIAAALVIALTAGARSRWRTQADVADEEDRARELAKGGSLSPPVQGWGDTKRWFFWYVYYRDGLTGVGPTQMTDQQAFYFEDNTAREHLGAKLYRFVWPGKDPWIYDTRDRPKLLAGEPIAPGVAGDTVGAVAVKPPVRGRWTARGFPEEVRMNGRVFKKATWQWPKPGVIAQYREAVPVNSHHLVVMRDGTFVVDHYDESNPDEGAVLEHLLNDVLLRPTGSIVRS